MKNIFLSITILFSNLNIFGQTQVGNSILGEAAGNRSGFSVSISSDGTRVAIGAPDNGDSSNNSGHVRIYEESDGSWTQIGSKIEGEAEFDASGYSVSISSDGTRVAIGAYLNEASNQTPGSDSNTGHVRVFGENEGAWTQIGGDIDGEAELDASGYSVSISSDGTRVAIGAFANDGGGNNSGHVRIYEESGSNWTQIGSDIDGEIANDLTGGSVSISSDGKRVAIGFYFNPDIISNSEYVRIYEENSGNWTQIGGNITGEVFGENFGSSVSISSNGKRVAIGAPEGDNDNGFESGNVRVYEESDGNWIQIGNIINGEAENDFSGRSVSISADGKRVAIGSAGNSDNGTVSGHTRIFEEINANWIQIGNDIDGENEFDFFGRSVSISADGLRVAIGADGNDENGNGSGHVRVFYNLDLTPVSNYLNNNQVVIYPNPVQNELVINGADQGQIQIFDIIGRLVLQTQFNDSRIDVSKVLGTGVYIIQINSENQFFTKKLIKN